MAYVTISQFRAQTGIDRVAMSDAEIGGYLGAASAMLESIAGVELGHIIESVTQNGLNVEAIVFGHMLESAGNIYVSGTGNSAFDGLRTFVRLTNDSIRITGVTLTGSEFPTGRVHKEYVKDFDVMDNRIRLVPSPVYVVTDVRVQPHFPDSGATAFDATTVLGVEDWYVPREGGSKYNAEVSVRSQQGRQYTRTRGFINPQPRRFRRISRVTFYVGTTVSPPPDLLTAIIAMAQQIAIDPSGDAQSESIDYYSISKRSLAELKEYPSSAIATYLRYKVN